MCRQPFRSTGFTLVELIVVIALLGVLTVFAASRMIGSDSFTPSMASQQTIALVRLAQQHAQSRQDVTISFVLDWYSDDWRFRVISDRSGTPKTLRETTLESRNLVIQITNDGSSETLGPAASLTLDFNGRGGVDSGTMVATSIDPDTGIALAFSGDSVHLVCVGSSGYGYRGACE